MYIKRNRVGVYSTTSMKVKDNIFRDFFPRVIADKLNKQSKNKSFKFKPYK